MEFDATFIIAAISFVVFVFIMNKIFYAPVLKIMQERQKFVEVNYQSADKTKEETQKQTDYHNSELEKSRDEARNMIREQTKLLKQEQQHQIEKYKSDSYDNISKEKENYKKSALEAKEILKEGVVDFAKDISHKILGDDINSDLISKSQIKE